MMKLFHGVRRRANFTLPAAALFSAAFVAVAPPSLAEDAYPDIVGTWTGEGLDVRLPADGSGVVFGSETIVQTITEQKDRRFTGSMHSGSTASEQFRVEFVGIFVDSKHFRWSEPNGFVEGRMIDADTIESCYVRTAPDGQNAACQTLKRQK